LNGFNVVSQSFTDIYMTVIVRSAVTGSDSSWVLRCKYTEGRRYHSLLL